MRSFIDFIYIIFNIVYSVPMILKACVHLLILSYAVAILTGVHLFPEIIFAAGVQKSPDSYPFDVILKFDKFVLALFILGFLRSKRKNSQPPCLRHVIATAVPMILFCSMALLLPAILIHYCRFDFKLSPVFPVWMLNNLILVCFAEEVFFRGYIQESLCQFLNHLKMPAFVGVAIASLLFGLAHFRGGPVFIGLAIVAGFFYGLSYARAGLWSSILVHFSINLIHFVFFSYPALFARPN